MCKPRSLEEAWLHELRSAVVYHRMYSLASHRSSKQTPVLRAETDPAVCVCGLSQSMAAAVVVGLFRYRCLNLVAGRGGAWGLQGEGES